MARNIKAIYSEAKEARDKVFQSTDHPGVKNSSKMSVMDALTWTTAACIWSFENLLDVWKVDVERDWRNRIVGTPQYYVNALLDYQHGDELVMDDNGLTFSYPSVNSSKKIISRVSYYEKSVDGFFDKQLILKVAGGTPGNYRPLTASELLKAKDYLRKISFAGTSALLVSRKGDVLLPRVTVYHDGALTENELLEKVKDSLNNYIATIPYDHDVYAQKVIDAILHTEHVQDVYIKPGTNQGIYVLQYDDANNPIVIDGKAEQLIDRKFSPNSGFVRESSGTNQEKNVDKWKDCISFETEIR